MNKNWMIVATGAVSIGLLTAAGWQGQAAADDAAQTAQAAPAVQTYTIVRGDLVLKTTRDGRLEAAEKIKVRLVPEAYTGPLEFTEVARSGGMVAAGEVLFRFDDSRLAENLRSARESLDDQRQRLAHAVAEQSVLAEGNARRLEQAEKALMDARNSLEVWQSYQGPRMLRAAELSLQSSNNNVHNQREELAQLELMYQGTELATETKDIVLDRAKRGLEIAEGWLQLSHGDYTVTVEFNYPRQNRDTEDAVRYRAEELAHLRINSAIAEIRKATEIVGIERAIRDGEERLAKLEADQERLVIRAPAGGLMTANEFQPGDTANARQVLTEIVNPTSKMLKFNATAADLRVLREGDRVQVAFPDLPEIAATATIREIALIGQPSGDTTHFPVIAIVESDNDMLRLGLRGRISAERTVRNVVLVPRKAVTHENGIAFVKIAREGDAEPTKREVTLGGSNDEHYQVVRGLEPGEAVVLPSKE
ncbi:MAG TPA: HlyD family efflux transporter periplasmic adaptor subunit [Phycisphaerales bacterium]|nr:HlyD family efflux transporter periplasmic adaptor subunit [Phycisphaerales bacterium]